jgi:hypothetical protein
VSSGAIDQAVQGAPPQFHEQALEAANRAFISGFNEILVIGGIVAIIGGILGMALVRKRDFVAVPQGPPAEAVPAS